MTSSTQSLASSPASGWGSAGAQGAPIAPSDRAAFEAYVESVRTRTEAALASALAERRARVQELGAADAIDLVEEVTSLTLRGGKRVRAVLVAAAYEACGGGDIEPILPALSACELLQTYLLIHDDWMDRDEVRRGGPSVHASLRARYGSDREAEVSAILAGDLAAAFALEELARCAVAPERLVAAVAAFARMQSTVVVGQQLDVRGNATTASAVERVHDLKTGSYTVRGPVALGAVLAGADEALREGLDAFARPLGIAFQLRDDLLGTFGNPRATGKPAGGDLREGKRTALVVDMLAQGGADRAMVERLLRGPAPSAGSPSDAQEIAERMVASGAKERVEARLAEQIDAARSGLGRLSLPDRGATLLRGAVAVLAGRQA